MQTALIYRTNRDLFSNYYLDEHLPETEAWDEVSDDELRDAKEDIMDLWEREKETAPKRNESQLEEKFIRPMFRKLGVPFEVEESTSRTQRRPDYGFFESEDAARGAFERREEGGDFYKDAVAVADAKRWGRPLDTRGSGEHERDFENPSYQIHVYLQETPARWAVLTDGKKWRLYYGPTSHRLDSYYEIDLPTVLEKGDLEDFKYFYLFFRHDALLEDSSGECFLDEVYDESNVFAQELGKDLQDNIYKAIKVLSEGFMQYPDNDLSEDDLDLIHDSSLIYLYRLIFVLYAESEGRDLLDTNNEIYEESYSLNTLKQDVAEELDSPNPKYRDWQDNLWDRLDELFKLIDQGSKSRGIPEEDLYIPAYNGGLFRTDPDEDDSAEARFIANHQVGDAYLAEVIELLTRSQNGNGGGKIFVDYSSLDVRHLGSIYEGLLEYQLDIADEPLALEDGEYVPAGEGDEVIVEEGEVHLSTGSGERKATGSYYTPEYVVEYIVEETLEPLVEDCRRNALDKKGSYGGLARAFADEVFDLKILDPAMGSGHFLTSAIDYLAREIIDAQEKQAAQQGIETVDEEHDINWARRQVAQRCIYGVDLNPLAVELAKVSLWLRTLAAEQPLAFLDHHLKTGNSLVGSDIETVLDNGDPDGAEEGQLTLQESFDRTRRQALEHVTDQFEDLLAIDNETLDDIKEMEAVYEEVRDDPLYQHLIAMANVHTAEEFGLDVPADAYERMAEALRDDSWADIEGQDWYKSAQAMAEDQRFFHWELEFPIAFYEQDGERKEDGGFDAVIGNPPWVDVKGLENPKVLFDFFETSFNRVNIYAAFIEQSSSLLSPGSNFGFITPNSYLTQSSYRPLREHILENYLLENIVRLPDGVFDGVTMETAILTAQFHPQHQNDTVEAIIFPRDITIAEIDSQTARHHTCDVSWWREQDELIFDIFTEEGEREVIQQVESCDTKLSDVFESCLGLTPYDKHQGHSKEEIENRVFHAEEQKSQNHYRTTTGEGINRYCLTWEGGEWIEYGDWLGSPREKRFFAEPRCVVRQIVSTEGRGIYAAYSEETLFHTQVGFVLLPKDESNQKRNAKALTGLLNSKLLTFYHRKRYLDENKDTFQKILIQDVNEFPLPNDFDDDDELIVHVESMTDLIQMRRSLNLNLLDYLGIPGDELPESKAGETLGGMQMPVAGVADTPLAETTEEYESLRIEGVSFAEDGGRVVLSVDISYKVEEDDPRETDRWDRLAESEFETYEAMAFVGLTEAEETLVREFIPVAVDKAGGFAGFRQGATKTNSPLDRLKDLTLPDIDEVQTGLEQYIEVRERADELEEKIEKTDQLIDEIVYDLYGLTDEEIEIIETAVQDD